MDLIAITGQTATGKTSLALETAAKHNGEVLNFDSRQVYKHLDIVTGKDIPKGSEFVTRNSQLINGNKINIGYYVLPVKLWLYDIADPKMMFSSFDFVTCAEAAISDILSRGKTPILVGGTYFYLKHLIYGFDSASPPNKLVRSAFDGMEVSMMRKRMASMEPGFSNVMKEMNESDVNNPRRLVRRYEIFIHSANQHHVDKEGLDRELKAKNIRITGLRYADREELRKNISARVRKRLDQGAVEETESLLRKGYKEDDPGLRTIGYVQIISYLKGIYDRETLVEKWITAEMQYAKRQLTFMKKDPNIEWREL